MRIESQVAADDYALIARLVATLTFIMGLVRTQRTALARACAGCSVWSSSEKTAAVLAGQSDATKTGTGDNPDNSSADATGNSDPDPASADPSKSDKPKGHGRLPATAYAAAEQIPVPHEHLSVGDVCPACSRGGRDRSGSASKHREW